MLHHISDSFLKSGNPWRRQIKFLTFCFILHQSYVKKLIFNIGHRLPFLSGGFERGLKMHG